MANELNDNKPNNITSCTLSMLNKLSTNTDDVTFQNKSIGLIEIIAKISEMREISQKYEFSLIDPTGKYKAIAYRNANKLKPSCFYNFSLTENGYVHIFGTIRKAEDTAFIINFIQNIKERTIVDEFLSRVFLSYLKIHKPSLSLSAHHEKILTLALRKAGFNQKGYTSIEIRNMINGELSMPQIEDLLNEMLINGKLKNGADWNHYSLML